MTMEEEGTRAGRKGAIVVSNFLRCYGELARAGSPRGGGSLAVTATSLFVPFGEGAPIVIPMLGRLGPALAFHSHLSR